MCPTARGTGAVVAPPRGARLRHAAAVTSAPAGLGTRDERLQEGVLVALQLLVVVPLLVLLGAATTADAYAGLDDESARDARRTSLLGLAADVDGATAVAAWLVLLLVVATALAALVPGRRAETVAAGLAGVLFAGWLALQALVARGSDAVRLDGNGYEAAGGAWWPGVLAVAVVTVVAARRAVRD